jgi:ferredoxin-NADP reductase/Na+-translocating ferredoxin:NAD+ oxidoreductase RnfD subunit
MYRLLFYGLSLIAAIGILFGAMGLISQDPWDLVLSLGILLVACYSANQLISKIWGAPTNTESVYITALILFFILSPNTTYEGAIFIFMAGVIAIASKFIIAIKAKHIFNPAAFGAATVGLAGLLYTSWWVGSPAMWPITVIYGALVVRKIRKYHLVAAFAVTSIAVTLITGLLSGENSLDLINALVTASPLIFLGTIMLTDPATTAPKRNQQMVYGALVGGLFAWHPTFGSFYIYPELALLLGNIYVYIVSPKFRSQLRLKRIEKISENVYNYVFLSDKKLNFQPGQYLEWTLPHQNVDLRGNRRTFSIASSPTENEISLGFKTYQPSSSYKLALLRMKPNDKIYTGQLAGDFVLPKDPSQKLVFIAGGIGITPFRSMIKYLTDTKQKRDIVLYYLVSNISEVAYKKVLAEAKNFGLKVIVVCPNKVPATTDNVIPKLDAVALKKFATNYTERTYYISGPSGLVDNYKAMLHKLSIPSKRIVTDHFSGY